MKNEDEKRVLLLDQDTEFLDQAKNLIEEDNDMIDVDIASNIDIGMNKLSEYDHHVIVSHHKIGGYEGLEFLEDVRRKLGSDIPFILLMNKKDNRITLKALKLEANRVFHKGENLFLSCQILNEIIKKEILNYNLKKELEHNRRFLRDGLLL